MSIIHPEKVASVTVAYFGLNIRLFDPVITKLKLETANYIYYYVLIE